MMRLREETEDGMRASDLLCTLHDAGIDTHHSSAEYPSMDIYLDALRTARASGRRFEHIVKVADPSFEDDVFDPARISARIDRELRDLGAERLASVQWLFRTSDVGDHDRRGSQLREQAGVIAECMQTLMASGKVGEFSCFPYALSFAREVAQHLPIQTLADYLSLFETSSLSLREDFDQIVAIRPYAGSDVALSQAPEFDALARDGLIKASDDRFARAIEFPLRSPWVASVVVSANSPESRRIAIEAGDLTPDPSLFDSWVDSLSSRSVMPA